MTHQTMASSPSGQVSSPATDFEIRLAHTGDTTYEKSRATKTLDTPKKSTLASHPPSLPLETSYWFRDNTPTTAAPLTGAAHADVAIIGGGFAGLSSALHLKQTAPHLRVALVESKHVGYGASGRNAGWLSSFPPLNWLMDDLTNPKNLSDFHFATHFCNQNIALLGKQIIATTTPDHWSATQHHLLARNPIERAIIYWLSSRLSLCSIPNTIIEQRRGAGPLANYPYIATLSWDTTLVNPYIIVSHLRQQCLAAGVELYENTPVASIQSSSDAVTINTEGGATLTAEKIILATNAYSAALARDIKLPTITARHTYMLATEELSPEFIRSISESKTSFTDPSLVYYCGRFHGNRFLFNGGDRASKASTADDQHAPSLTRLYREMLRRFPQLGETKIQSAWGGAFMETASETPIVRASSTNPNIIFNIGYGGGSGIDAALQSGRLTTDLILGNQSHDSDARRLHKFFDAYHASPLGYPRAVIGGFKNLLHRKVQA